MAGDGYEFSESSVAVIEAAMRRAGTSRSFDKVKGLLRSAIVNGNHKATAVGVASTSVSQGSEATEFELSTDGDLEVVRCTVTVTHEGYASRDGSDAQSYWIGI